MLINSSLRNHQFVFETKAGLFSKDRIDQGSLMLIEHVHVSDGDTILDIGCGYGAIGLALAKCNPHGTVHMVDTDIRAIEQCRINSVINHVGNTIILPSDGFKHLPPDLTFDLVVSNPPSHVPKELLIEFIKDAKSRLTKNGQICFVTENRIVPLIRREFQRIFQNHSMPVRNDSYTLSIATNN